MKKLESLKTDLLLSSLLFDQSKRKGNTLCSFLTASFAFCHGLVKTPESGDFRVQEDFGGKNAVIVPGSELIGFARSVVESVSPTPLYSRTDMVRGNDGNLLLMELELIEPALYFRYGEHAPVRFAEALIRRL